MAYRALSLPGRDLGGNIPAAVSALVHLTMLDLSANGLESTIPSGIAALTGLVHLNLSRNSLRGGLPNWSSVVPHEYVATGGTAASKLIPRVAS